MFMTDASIAIIELDKCIYSKYIYREMFITVTSTSFQQEEVYLEVTEPYLQFFSTSPPIFFYQLIIILEEKIEKGFVNILSNSLLTS